MTARYLALHTVIVTAVLAPIAVMCVISDRQMGKVVCGTGSGRGWQGMQGRDYIHSVQVGEEIEVSQDE